MTLECSSLICLAFQMAPQLPLGTQPCNSLLLTLALFGQWAMPWLPLPHQLPALPLARTVVATHMHQACHLLLLPVALTVDLDLQPLHTMEVEQEDQLILTLLLELDTLLMILMFELPTKLAKLSATTFPETDSASSVSSRTTSLVLK